MGIIFDKEGIFVPDCEKDRLMMEIPDEIFAEMKKITNETFEKGTQKKSFLTNNYYDVSEGAMISRDFAVEGIQKNVAKYREMKNNFKKKNIIKCMNCNKDSEFTSKIHTCPNCKNTISVKEYKKKYIKNEIQISAISSVAYGIKRGML